MPITKERMLQETLEKVGKSLPSINNMMTSSFEMETYSRIEPDEVRLTLRHLNGGSNRNKNIGNNVGNGWNDDSHADGTVNYNDDLQGWYDLEVSSCPLNNVDFEGIRTETENMLSTLKQATELRHSCMASCHIHTTIRYNTDYNSVIVLPNNEIFNRIARFMLKFMPIMKWLSMSNYSGARGSVYKSRSRERNPYDKLENDYLFDWWNNYYGEIHNDSSYYLKRMQRDSYFRIHNDNYGLHWENRMADQTASHTQLALNMTINRAITLWAIDMARKDYNLKLDSSQVREVKDEMRRIRQGYLSVRKDFIEQQWREMKGYLVKYFAMTNSMDVIKYGDKLVEKPVSAWLNGKGYREHFNPFEIEQVFNERNRPKDEKLRGDYLKAIDSMTVSVADSLNDFHINVANHLGISEKQAKSLYQMFNRENVDIRFMGGRLVYMGD